MNILQEKLVKTNPKSLQFSIETGNIVEYKNKEYVVCDWQILNAGHTREVSLVRCNTQWASPLLRIVRHIYDDDINSLKLIK